MAAHPRVDDLVAFRIPHGVFVRLHKGTWHAGAPARACGAAGQGDMGARGVARPAALTLAVPCIPLGRRSQPGAAGLGTRAPCLPRPSAPPPPPSRAGPLFDGPQADFYNLELSDTNVVDHNTHDYKAAEALEYEVAD